MAAMWSLIAIAEGRQYGGNDGYEDHPSTHYRYDSRVPNHKQLAVGDVVFIRNGGYVLGAAKVEAIELEPGAKLERRCPMCSAVNVRERKFRQPPWRCSKCKAEFEKPVEAVVDVTSFTALYETSFKPAPPGIPAAALKSAAVSPNDQLAIERIDESALWKAIGSSFPAAEELLLSVAVSTTLGPLEATATSGTPAKPGYVTWEGDEREAVLRSIRIRRGQQTFRKALIKAYGGVCVISGCELLDLLEAAHISPYKGKADNHAENGLLLRADLHTLFDLGLLAIEPDNKRVWFSKGARGAGYGHLHGKLISVGNVIPSSAALRARWAQFTQHHGLGITESEQ